MCADRRAATGVSLGRLYEESAGVAPRRSAGGVFYTPDHVVEYVVGGALPPLLQAAPPGAGGGLRIVDPACGGGVFLVAAFKHLVRWYQEAAGPRRLTCEDRARIAQAHLFGADVDPQALAVTRLSLMLEVFAGEAVVDLDLSDNLRVGDALLDDALLPAGTFHAVLGNPPWVHSKRLSPDDRRRHRDRFASAGRQYDLFGCFVERGVELLHPDGVLGFVVPSRLLMNPAYEALRRLLLTRTTLLDLTDLGDDVFPGVAMPSLTLTCRRSRASGADVRARVDVEDLAAGRWTERHVPQARMAAAPGAIFTIYEDPTLAPVFAKMDAASTPLSSLAHTSRGDEIGKSHRAVRPAPGPGLVPFLVGADVARYRVVGEHGLKLDEIPRPKEDHLFAGERILVRTTGTGIPAPLDVEGRRVIQVVYMIRPTTDRVSARCLLAILNSRLMGRYYFARFGEEKKSAFPHLRQATLRGLPIAVPAPEAALALERLVDRRLAAAPHEVPELERAIDERVCDLYGLGADQRAAL